MFLFDYIGLAYSRKNDTTHLGIRIMLYYSSVGLIDEYNMENNTDH